MKKALACIVLPMAVLLMAGGVVAQEHSQGDQTSGAEGEVAVGVPDLAEIIPLASELSGRLATLENRIASVLDTSAIEKEYDRIEANLKDPADELQRLKDSEDYKYNKLAKLRETIRKEDELFAETSQPLTEAISQLGFWRKEWLAEQQRWNEWQSSLGEEEELEQLKSTFEKANRTIDTALGLILPRLEEMLAVQQKAGSIQERIYALAAELDGLIVSERRDALLTESPPMFSSRYFRTVASLLDRDGSYSSRVSFFSS
jgi:chromosome condensin MukBEF ATPase and DNA-binding subunit MukB